MRFQLFIQDFFALMDEWFGIIVRQLILYSLPVLVSLTCVVAMEALFTRRQVPNPFYALSWRSTWLLLLASLIFHRAVIIALPKAIGSGIKPALARFSGHLALAFAGFLLYTWSMGHQPPVGLPPVHFWWAKVFMYFNLCMAVLHLLPLPDLLIGECMSRTKVAIYIGTYFNRGHGWIVLALLSASPLLDLTLGGAIIFPLYELLSDLASSLSSQVSQAK